MRGPVADKHLLQLVGRPGIKLLDANDGDVPLLAGLLAPGQQVIIDLARAEQDPAGPIGGGLFVQHVAEMAVCELVQRRDRQFMAQQALGSHNDQRFAEAAADLAAEQVKVLGRR